MKKMKWMSSLFLVLTMLCFLRTEVVAETKTQTRFVQPEKENLRATPNGKKIGELLQGTELMVQEKKGKWLKVQVTGWIYEPSTTPNKAEIKMWQEKKQKLVEFVNSKVERLSTKEIYGLEVSQPHIRAYFQFQNNAKKTLTGLVYETTFMDSFGDVLYKTTMKSQLKIAPGQQNKMDTYWYWEDNPFIDGEVYDKLQSAVGAGTIKVKVRIKKAVFEDGSIVNF